MGKFRSISGDPPRLQTDTVCITHQDGGMYVVLVSEHDDESRVMAKYTSLDDAVEACGRYLRGSMIQLEREQIEL